MSNEPEEVTAWFERTEKEQLQLAELRKFEIEKAKLVLESESIGLESLKKTRGVDGYLCMRDEIALRFAQSILMRPDSTSIGLIKESMQLANEFMEARKK